MDHAGRLERLGELLGEAAFDAFLISHLPHLGYLFDFWGSAGMAIWEPQECRLFVDGRYFEEARRQAVHCTPLAVERSHLEAARTALEAVGPRRLAVETGHLSASAFLLLQSALGCGSELADAGEPVERLRRVKEPAEVDLIRDAFEMTERVLAETLAHVEPGVTELEIGAEVAWRGLRAGAEGMAFDTLVASGPRTALPHAVPTERRWQAGEPLLVDVGFRRHRYVSDLTRMVDPEAIDAEMAAVVSAARMAAFASIRPGVESAEVDRAARRVIEAAGFGEGLLHSTGHGLGLEVHEAPALSRRRSQVLEEGMVVTLEPAIYRPGRGGIRLEDAALVTARGARWISGPAP